MEDSPVIEILTQYFPKWLLSFVFLVFELRGTDTVQNVFELMIFWGKMGALIRKSTFRNEKMQLLYMKVSGVSKTSGFFPFFFPPKRLQHLLEWMEWLFSLNPVRVHCIAFYNVTFLHLSWHTDLGNVTSIICRCWMVRKTLPAPPSSLPP